MPESHDIDRLHHILTEQFSLRVAIGTAETDDDRNELEEKLKAIRSEVIELVDKYFRIALYPILKKRFPEVFRADERNVNHIAQLTELLNDFFIRVLAKSDDPFWRFRTKIELRNYASLVISNRGIRNAFRRRKKAKDWESIEVDACMEQLATEFADRAKKLPFDPAKVIEAITFWDSSDNDQQKQYAQLLRLFYVSGMKMADVAIDLGVGNSTAYAIHRRALRELRQAIEKDDSKREGE